MILRGLGGCSEVACMAGSGVACMHEMQCESEAAKGHSGNAGARVIASSLF